MDQNPMGGSRDAIKALEAAGVSLNGVQPERREVLASFTPEQVEIVIGIQDQLGIGLDTQIDDGDIAGLLIF